MSQSAGGFLALVFLRYRFPAIPSVFLGPISKSRTGQFRQYRHLCTGLRGFMQYAFHVGMSPATIARCPCIFAPFAGAFLSELLREILSLDVVIAAKHSNVPVTAYGG